MSSIKNRAVANQIKSPKKKSRSPYRIATPIEFVALLLLKKQDPTPQGKAELEEA